MNTERPELPIERLLLAFVRTHGDEQCTNTRLGAQMLSSAADVLQAAWAWHQKKPTDKDLDEWEMWNQLILVIPVYNQVAKTMNLPTIQVAELNALAQATRREQRQKLNLEQLALACKDAGDYLATQNPLVETALQRGKHARR